MVSYWLLEKHNLVRWGKLGSLIEKKEIAKQENSSLAAELDPCSLP